MNQNDKQSLSNQILFSVIVPVYNTELYLKRCIDSILKQSFRDFECILVDDGSTDSSGLICDQFAREDSRFVVVHSENQGVSAARNLGIKHASGEYIVFIDSDDWVHENYLEDMVCSDSDFLCQQFMICSEDEKIDKRFELKQDYCDGLSEFNQLELLKSGALRYVFSKRYKREIISEKRIQFDIDVDISEDTLFNVDYIVHCRTASLQPISNYFYVRYVTRKTLSNEISIERFASICIAKGKIAARLFSRETKEYQSLYYYLIGYSYMCYQWSVYFKKQRGVLENYFFGISFMNNKDVRKVIEYSPDAIWTLPVSPRMIHAYQNNNRLELLKACMLEKYHQLARRRG